MSAVQRWLRAVRHADDTGDTSALIELLQSDLEIDTGARKLLADLLDRHQLKRWPGGQRRPVYQKRSFREMEIAAAVGQVRKLTAKGLSVSDAIDAVIPYFDIDPDEHRAGVILQTAVEGKRGSARKSKN